MVVQCATYYLDYPLRASPLLLARAVLKLILGGFKIHRDPIL